jgi:hypothetical protein
VAVVVAVGSASTAHDPAHTPAAVVGGPGMRTT